MNLFRNRVVGYLVWRLVLRNPGFRARLQRILFGTGSREVELFGQPLTVDAQLEFGYARAARLQHHSIVFAHEAPQLMTVMSFLGDECTFVDVGANVGLWTTAAASIGRLKRGVRTIAFEANPDTHARLVRNVGSLPGVTVHQAAISDRVHSLTFYGGASSGVFGAEKLHFNTEKTQTIEARPLDPFIEGIGDLVVKIDVEGHEAPVLRGMSNALAERRVRAIFIDGYLEKDETEIVDVLTRGGFALFDARRRQPFAACGVPAPLLGVRLGQ